MAEASITRDAGIAYLDTEISEAYEGDEIYELAKILRRFIAKDGVTPQEAAQQIDSYYEDDLLPSQPILQREKARGMVNLLGALDDLICDLGSVLHYDDVRQDDLIQLILELRKLPPRQVVIGNVSKSTLRPVSSFHMQYLADISLRKNAMFIRMTRYLLGTFLRIGIGFTVRKTHYIRNLLPYWYS